MSSFTLEEVSRTAKETNSCWIVVDGKVYNVTSFLDEHPGGKRVLTQVSGTDASKKFHTFHNASVLQKYGPTFYVGDLVESSKGPQSNQTKALTPVPTPAPTASTPVPSQSSTVPRQSSTATAPAPVPSKSLGIMQFEDPQLNKFGEQIPYGDPNWYQEWYSPYYNQSHRTIREAVRKYAEEKLAPHISEWEKKQEMPIKALLKEAAQFGLLAGVLGPPWPTKYAGENIIGGIKPEEFDRFHCLVLFDEFFRVTCGGAGFMAGLSIGLPPILNFGSESLKDRIAGPCLKGEKVICLAITEPNAGSDVANLQTEAVLSPDKKFYIVNGEKKWITNGIYADYFTTAVRTGGPGRGGVSVLVIERGPGVNTRKMETTGLMPSGTAYITFENVKVPVENLVGKENKGFNIIMYNFNHERMAVIIEANRLARVCYEEAFVYAFTRKTFGKRLIDHPVIRNKFAHMIRHIETTQALIESVSLQMSIMSHKEAAKLGGITAILKAHSTRTLEYCVREASQIFGGLSYTKGGRGDKIERILRMTRAVSIYAGSEEIMLDLGVRQAMRSMPTLPASL